MLPWNLTHIDSLKIHNNPCFPLKSTRKTFQHVTAVAQIEPAHVDLQTVELELGQDATEVWNVLLLNPGWTSSSNSAIFENNPCILYTGTTDYPLEYHNIYSWAPERQLKKKKQVPVCISIRTPHFQNFEHQWKICHHMHELLRCDMMWLSEASAVSDVQNEESWSVHRKHKQGHLTSSWVFKLLLKLWYRWFYKQWDRPRSETQTPFQRGGGETSLRVHLTYVTLKAVILIADIWYICSS